MGTTDGAIAGDERTISVSAASKRHLEKGTSRLISGVAPAECCGGISMPTYLLTYGVDRYILIGNEDRISWVGNARTPIGGRFCVQETKLRVTSAPHHQT